MRVVLMEAAAARFRSQGCEQLAAVACVFASDGVHSNQQGPGPRGKITQVTDRCANQIKNPRFRFGALLHNGSALISP